MKIELLVHARKHAAAIIGIRLFTLVLGVVAANLVYAEPVDWLYDVQVPVAARTQQAAEGALPRALEVLLMRLTGLSSIPETPAVQSAMVSLSTFVKQYEFITLPPNSPYENGDAVVPKFNSSLVRDLIKDARLPLWPADRPSVLLWMTVHEGDNSELVQDGASLALQLRKRALERGIELVIPILDLEDQATLTSSSITGGFWNDLAAASERYEAEFVAAVSSQKDLFGRYQSSITYWYQGTESFDFREINTRKELSATVIDHVVDIIVTQHAIVREQEEIFRIGFIDVDDVESYAALLTQLKQLDFVDDFMLVSFENKVLIFDVYTPSPPNLFVDLMDAIPAFQTVEFNARPVVSKKVMQFFSWVHES